MNFEDFMSGLGFDPFNPGCGDIPGGFQDLNPELFSLLGELLGNVIAGNLPINVQNAVGNWFELLGQVILTYNAQQQYFQNGPGRYYNVIYKNVGNPFCSQGSSTASETNTDGVENVENKKNSSTSSSLDNDIDSIKKEMKSLIRQVKELKNELETLKSEI